MPKKAKAVLVVAFWLLVWHLASLAIGEEILLVSPLTVVRRLVSLAATAEFWYSLAHSLARIAIGFLLAVAAGVVLAVCAYRSGTVRILLDPLVKTIKAIPVASFIILLLIWIPSRNLSVATSFLMCWPIVYRTTLEGLDDTDPRLLEMAAVFRIPQRKRIVSIYLSQVLPFLSSAVSLSLGLAWKSGIAAEVIGLPDHTLGDHLYQAKTYLDTPDLFAYTLAIVLASFLCERVVMHLLHRMAEKLEMSA